MKPFASILPKVAINHQHREAFMGKWEFSDIFEQMTFVILAAGALLVSDIRYSNAPQQALLQPVAAQ